MTELVIALVGLGGFGIALWLIGRLTSAEDTAKRTVYDDITREALNAKRREAKAYSEPLAGSWSDTVDRL